MLPAKRPSIEPGQIEGIRAFAAAGCIGGPAVQEAALPLASERAQP